MTIASNPIASSPIASSSLGEVVERDTFNVFINSVDVSGNVFTGSSGSQGFSISDILTGTTTGTLILVEDDAPTGPTLDIEIGHEVIIEHKTGRIFGGIIEDLKRTNPGQSDVLFYNLSLRDYSACLTRRLVPASYEDTGDPVTQTAGSIITSLFNLFVSDECIVLGTIEDGPLIQKANFDYVTVESALNDIQRLTGNTYFWKVDAHKVLSFRERTAVPAPYEIDETQADILNLDFESSKESYRNRQYVRGGKTETDPRTEEFEADGKLKAFTTTLPLAAKPVIEVNTVAVDPDAIGVKGVDEDIDAILWLYGVDSDVVAAKTAPSSGDDIEITYQGLFPIIVQLDNNSEQTERKTIELGDGIYESIDTDESLNLSSTRQKADALLDKYARIPKSITYQTDRIGDLQPGQIQTVNLTRLDVTGAEMLIEQVDTVLNGEDLRRTVKATDGREWLEWLEWFRDLLRGPFLIRENESIITPLSVADDIDVSDSVVVNLTDDLNPYTDDIYSWMIVGSDFSIARKIDDPDPFVFFADSEQVDGPNIGDPVIT